MAGKLLRGLPFPPPAFEGTSFVGVTMSACRAAAKGGLWPLLSASGRAV